MHHDIRAGSTVRAVISIGVTDVERHVIVGVGVHLRRRDGVKPLGSLPVALRYLGAELTRPAADRVRPEQGEAARRVLLPYLEFRFFLEQSDENRCPLRHMLLFEPRHHLGRQWSERTRTGARAVS